MREYLRWVASTFTDTRLYGQATTYEAVIREFKANFTRDSLEYGELLNFYLAHASDRYTRLGIMALVETMHAENQTIRHIHSSLDGDLHQYIQWIVRNRPDACPPDCSKSNAHILGRFLETVPRDSPVYKKVFARFYGYRHSNHSDKAINSFVSEVNWQMSNARRFSLP